MYFILVSVRTTQMIQSLRTSLFLFLVIAVVGIVASFRNEKLIRTEWIILCMGERSKRKREKQQESIDGLISDLLPKKVIRRMKDGYVGSFAEVFPSCTVIFANLNDYSKTVVQLSPTEIINTLNLIFQSFDRILERYTGVEKVKTVGDCYMVVSGVPDRYADHAKEAVDVALDMLAVLKEIAQGAISMRVGVHTGSVTAGIVGWSKISYDIWGETVDIARMCESYGVPDYVQLTKETFYELKAADFRVEPAPQLKYKDHNIDVMLLLGRNYHKDLLGFVYP